MRWLPAHLARRTHWREAFALELGELFATLVVHILVDHAGRDFDLAEVVQLLHVCPFALLGHHNIHPLDDFVC
jgi:hypothetical protein